MNSINLAMGHKKKPLIIFSKWKSIQVSSDTIQLNQNFNHPENLKTLF